MHTFPIFKTQWQGVFPIYFLAVLYSELQLYRIHDNGVLFMHSGNFGNNVVTTS